MKERSTFTVKGLSKLWDKEEEEIEEYFREGKLFCSVRLEGEFLKHRRSKDGVEEVPCGTMHIRQHLLEPKYNEFKITNYNHVISYDDEGFLDLQSAHFSYVGYDGYTYELGMHGLLPNLKKNKLFITREEVERFEREFPDTVKAGVFEHLEHAKEQENETDTGGRPPGQLKEAIERLYLHLQGQGNTSMLRPRRIKEFLSSLQECLSGTDKVSEYIQNRIDKVNLKDTAKTVRVIGDMNSEGKDSQSRFYDQDRVSQILSEMRKKYPLS